jgi:membrane protease YdiL (CAAX protease family)
MNIKRLVDWKIYFLLLSVSFLSILAIMPYIITLQGDTLKAAPMPFPLVILIVVFQSTLLFAILTFIGLKLSKKIGLKMPIIEGLFYKNKINYSSNIKSIIKISALLGLLTGIVIVFLDFVFFQFGLESLFEQISVPIWQGFLASFYGGISEEILMRLFFMTFIIWLISKITKPKGKILENNLVVWTSIILSSLLFGIGHLPITSELITLTPLVIFRALLLNGIGGVIFGWLYWKKGLESAMIAHFSADIILHVCLPLILIIL